MTLHRTAVRAATVALLKGATAAGDRVWPTRIMPLSTDSYPAILVYTLREDITGNGTAPAQFRHDLDLAIEIHWCPPDAELDDVEGDVEDALDAMCETILDRLLIDPAWVAQFEEITGANTVIGFDAQGKHVPMGARIVLSGRFSSMWEPVIPDGLASMSFGIDAIDPADPNHSVPGPDGRAEAGATIPIPTT